MRTARNLTLLAMLTIVTTTLTSPSGYAQTEPELHNQLPRLIAAREVHVTTDAACPVVTPTPPPSAPARSPTLTAGGCRLHFSGVDFVRTAHLSAGGTEVVVDRCDVEFDSRLDSAGEGWISHQEYTQGATGTCMRTACGQVDPPSGEGRAYTAYAQETEVAGQGPRESMAILFCFETVGSPDSPSHCEVTVAMSQPTKHRYRLTATDTASHDATFPQCELDGTFDQEAVLGTTGEGQLEQNVEIRHI